MSSQATDGHDDPFRQLMRGFVPMPALHAEVEFGFFGYGPVKNGFIGAIVPYKDFNPDLKIRRLS